MIQFSLEPQRQSLGFLQPFQFFAEGGLQAEEQDLIPRALRRAPAPAGMVIKLIFSHGKIPFSILQSVLSP